MGVFFDIEQLPKFRNAVVTIGTFDGVHQGHKTILQEVARHAKKVKGESVLITFEPHPRKLLFPKQPIHLITPLDKKLQLIAALGIEHIVVAPFTKAFSELTAEEYIESFLVKYFHPNSIIIGYDHHFGHDRKGNIDMLKAYAGKHHFEVVEIPAQLIEQAAVSSTKIRQALERGHVEDAAHMLGRNYTLTGSVTKGAQLGRTIGYPTANIIPAEAELVVPARGIYAVRAKINGQQLNGMMSIGYNPTVTDSKEIKIEVNLFDFDKDIYGQEIEIEFVAWLRKEEKFASIDELKAQLHKDKQKTLQALH